MIFPNNIDYMLKELDFAEQSIEAISLTIKEHPNMSPEIRIRLQNTKLAREVEYEAIYQLLVDHFDYLPINKIMEEIFA